jgi:hypothetical protein
MNDPGGEGGSGAKKGVKNLTDVSCAELERGSVARRMSIDPTKLQVELRGPLEFTSRRDRLEGHRDQEIR